MIFVEREEDWEKKRFEVNLIILYLKESIKLNWNQFEARIKDLPKTKKIAMTVYEDILQRGIQLGIKEGKEEGKAGGKAEGHEEMPGIIRL